MEKTKLTKAVIIEHLHEKLGINRNDIHEIVDEFFEEVKAGLKEEMIIELRGFGTFEVRTRKGREKARNPKTGELVAAHFHKGQEIIVRGEMNSRKIEKDGVKRVYWTINVDEFDFCGSKQNADSMEQLEEDSPF